MSNTLRIQSKLSWEISLSSFPGVISEGEIALKNLVVVNINASLGLIIWLHGTVNERVFTCGFKAYSIFDCK